MCSECFKSEKYCICSEISAQGVIDHTLNILILQHPQEPKEPLSTARIASKLFSKCDVKVGLSWPNLTKALLKTKFQTEKPNPKEWGVLYLGSKSEEKTKATPPLKGLIVLDGTWSQAKTLWWRNAWLLKLNRVILSPKTPSAYGKFRKEPRPESLSTLESIGLFLSESEKNPKIFERSHDTLKLLLKRFEK